MKKLYGLMASSGPGMPAAALARGCEQIAFKYPAQRIPALTLAGLFALSADPALAVRALEEVYASGIEIANEKVLRKYSPIRVFFVKANDQEIPVPVGRDLIKIRLAVLYMVARRFDQAAAMAAEISNRPIGNDIAGKIAVARRNINVRPSQPVPRTDI